MDYFHVDVFSEKVLSGNGLTVVFSDRELEECFMLELTKEFKQFETIFLRRIEDTIFRARIFTVEEELDFAGHPILGATAAIHSYYFVDKENIEIIFQLDNKTVATHSKKEVHYYDVQMNQGKPEFIAKVSEEKKIQYVQGLNLAEENVSKKYPMEVVSTGLPYLLVPLVSGIENARIVCSEFEEMLEEINAKFTYVFDLNEVEGRTWDNHGNVEDVATGSAAGPLGAYLYKHNIFRKDQEIIINQGRFVGRPSKIKVFRSDSRDEIIVAGNVVILAKGTIFI